MKQYNGIKKNNTNDKISVLCFCKSPKIEFAENDATSQDLEQRRDLYDFRFRSVHAALIAEDMKTAFPLSPRPDVIVVDLENPDIETVNSLFNVIDHMFSDFPIIIAFFFNSDPGPILRLEVLQKKYLSFLKPFSFKEFDLRIQEQIKIDETHKTMTWQEHHLAKSFDYIEKLRKKILNTRKDLMSEKEMLHNALKQINLMTEERDRLKKNLEQKKTDLYENLKGVEKFLSSMMEAGNEIKRGHLLRVAEISRFMAERLSLGRGTCKNLEKAALLHEAGMLLMPPSIIVKPDDQRTEYEKTMLAFNPSKGADFLARCPGFKKAADIIRYLNENVDGSGFPEGLKRRYIPVPSRILAGADYLDTWCIENTCYTMDDLLIALEKTAGVRLDPTVVNLVGRYAVMNLNKDAEKLKEYPIYKLEPGMVTGAGLFTKTGTKLFSAGTELTEASIKMMVRYNREYPVDETVFIKVK